jgi:hypothetical protein
MTAFNRFNWLSARELGSTFSDSDIQSECIAPSCGVPGARGSLLVDC